VKAKKIWGQHFLNAPWVIEKILQAIPEISNQHIVMEVGPGQGILTKHLLDKFGERFYAIEVDPDLIDYLPKHFPQLKGRLIHKDFLKFDLAAFSNNPMIIIGNFPYNISSQIVFKALEQRNRVTHVIGMFQKEMALRIVSPPGSKDYGILSVLAGAFYNGKYLFDVDRTCFNPPPNVTSGVIRLDRNRVQQLTVDETLFIKVVKAVFNQRRKMLRNSLSSMVNNKLILENNYFTKRPEQLSIDDFIAITQLIESGNKT
jgi:16S rRNA (adenine1518-N6/adenine1519-N6)-dimethyltransferase